MNCDSDPDISVDNAVEVAPAASRAKAMSENCFAYDTEVHIRVSEETQCLVGDYVRWSGDRKSMVGAAVRCDIQYLVPGVEVLARCEKTGEVAYRKILNKTIGYPKGDVYEISYHYSEDDRSRSVEATGCHPFWVVGKGWVECRHLQKDDILVAQRGGVGKVESVLRDPKSALSPPVYNLEVEEFHTYFVGPIGIWVHNTKPGLVKALHPKNKKYRSWGRN